MGIKHKAVKASDEKGYAIEWNDEHVISGDVDFLGFNLYNVDYVQLGDVEVSGTLDMFNAPINMDAHQIINLAEPVNLSDAATKNYVDARIKKGIYQSSQNLNISNSAWITIGTIILTVQADQAVLLNFTTNWQPTGTDNVMAFQFTREGTNIGGFQTKEDNGGIGSDTFHMHYLDAPGSTASYTYRVQAQSQMDGTADLYDSIFTAIAL